MKDQGTSSKNAQKMNDDTSIASLMQYYETSLARAVRCAGNKGGLNSQALQKQNPLSIEKIEASDAHCDTRYPQGCWSIQTHEGLHLMSDTRDEKGARLLLDIAADYLATGSHICEGATGGYLVGQIRRNVGLWPDPNGGSYSLGGNDRWYGAPVSAFCLHFVNSEEDSSVHHLIADFDSRLGQDIPVKVNLLLDYRKIQTMIKQGNQLFILQGVDVEQILTLQGVHIKCLGDSIDSLPSLSANAYSTTNEPLRGRLCFDLNKTNKKENGSFLSLLGFNVQLQDHQPPQAPNFPEFVPFNDSDRHLIRRALDLNDCLFELSELRNRIMEGKDVRYDASVFPLSKLVCYACEGAWANGIQLKKPVWDSAALINEVLSDKKIAKEMERSNDYVEWSRALADIFLMHPCQEKRQLIDVISKHLSGSLNHATGASLDDATQCFFREINMLSKHYSSIDLECLSDPPPALNVLLEKGLDNWQQRTSDDLKQANGSVNDHWFACNILNPLMIDFFKLPATKATEDFICKRFLEKMPDDGLQKLVDLMHLDWVDDFQQKTGKTIGEQFDGFLPVLLRHLNARHAQDDASLKQHASLTESSGAPVVPVATKKRKSPRAGM